MSKKNVNTKNGFSLDWLIQGILTKLGETFDGFTGRKWSPSSSLATSELIERLKLLLDAEVRDLGARGKFVPHNLKLKTQWDKFSTDAAESLKKLENELLTAAVDHINDKRYHTFAPLKFEIKPDYFTDGVKLQVSFDNFTEDENEAEMNVTLPDVKLNDLPVQVSTPIDSNTAESFFASFTANGSGQKIKLTLQNNQRLSVGRSRENDLAISDESVSKIHASLVLSNQENALMVADTGSTNGTFINGKRISYGTAALIGKDDTVSFGNIDVVFEHIPKPVETAGLINSPAKDSLTINGFEFKSKSDAGDFDLDLIGNDALETETEVRGKNIK
jgi:pSer/pThr/pTyr-binding forkhead associated (FHA) protein